MQSNNRVKMAFIIAALCLTGVLLLVQPTADLRAQSAPNFTNWSFPQRIPGYADTTPPPILVADSTGLVHAFSYQELPNTSPPRIAVIHSIWDRQDGWTPPVDILLSPIKRQARVTDVYIDKNDTIHLVFYGGDEGEANIYYTFAAADQAGKASAWSRPVAIGLRAITPSMANIRAVDADTLVMVFNSKLDGNGLFSTQSDDGGATWSEAQPVFLTYNNDLLPYGLVLEAADTQTLYAAWQVVNEVGHNIAGYYAYFDVETGQWSVPTELDQGIGVENGMGIANPALIAYQDEVFIAYNNGIPPSGVPPTNYVRQLNEASGQLTPPLRISTDHVGRNGVMSFLVDSEQTLHLFFANRIPLAGAEAIHGLWHVQWEGDRWSEVTPVVTEESRIGDQAFDPYDARVVIAAGDVVLVTWRTDPGVGRNGVWYAHNAADGQLVGGDGGEVAETLSQTETNVGDSGSDLETVDGGEVTAVSPPANTTPTSPTIADNVGNEQKAWSQTWLIYVSLLPVFIVIGLAIAFVVTRKTR